MADSFDALPNFLVHWQGVMHAVDGDITYTEALAPGESTTLQPGEASAAAEECRVALLPWPDTMTQDEINARIGPSPFKQPALPSSGKKGWGGHHD